jgi:benzoyl-CoA reductase/2-hydroxyglutaryl-CoA dehydratase subunit BcrC/BadD/HgdB
VTRYTNDDSGIIYLKKELELLSKDIETTLDRPFSKEGYSRALTLIGGFRLDAQFLYAARVIDPSILSYSELSHLVRSFLTAPVTSVGFDIHEVAVDIREKLKKSGLLEATNSVLEGLLNKDLSNVTQLDNLQRPRILVVGGMVEPQAISTIINSIEGYSDVHLVMDLLSFGYKTVFTPSADIFGDPYEEMAKSILAAPSEPTQEGLQHRMMFLKQIVNTLKIDGIIVCEQSFCDPDQFEAPSIEKAVSEDGVRTIRIHLDPELSDRARIEVKIQTFLESMGV